MEGRGAYYSGTMGTHIRYSKDDFQKQWTSKVFSIFTQMCIVQQCSLLYIDVQDCTLLYINIQYNNVLLLYTSGNPPAFYHDKHCTINCCHLILQIFYYTGADCGQCDDRPGPALQVSRENILQLWPMLVQICVHQRIYISDRRVSPPLCCP